MTAGKEKKQVRKKKLFSVCHVKVMRHVYDFKTKNDDKRVDYNFRFYVRLSFFRLPLVAP